MSTTARSYAQLLARTANVLHFAGESDRVDALSARALETARRIGDPAALVAALESRHAALLHAHLDERLRLSEELLALARRIGRARARVHRAALAQLRPARVRRGGRGPRAVGSARPAGRTSCSQPMYRYFSLRWEGMWAQTDDRLEDAARLIDDGEAMGVRAQQPDVHVQAMGQRLALAYRQRMLGGFAAMIETSIAENPQLQVNRPVLALAHLQAGDREAGSRRVRASSRRTASPSFPRDVIWFSTICLLAEVCALLEDTRPGGDALRHDPPPSRHATS